MKTELLNIAKGIMLLVLYMSPFIILMAYMLVKWGRKGLSKEKAEYDLVYSRIEQAIKDYPSQDLAYKRLMLKYIDELKRLPYRNREKTEVLLNKILFKFEKAEKEVESILK